MKRLIHRYLSSAYYVKGNLVYSYTENGRFRSILLIKDLDKIFGLKKPELKWIVKSWFKKQNKGFNFNKYWNPIQKWDNVFPITSFNDCRLISSDLVEVRPMGMPSSIVHYMNVSYQPDMPIRHIEVDIRINPTKEELEAQIKDMATHYENIRIVEEAQSPSVTYSRPSGGW